ncbi:MAG: hypothetical protein EXR72_07125 [Myxococcales bacterium]|nr:hypothetical protein [Myxococcales bacterium]
MVTAPFTTVLPLAGDAGSHMAKDIIAFYIGGLGDYYAELLRGFGFGELLLLVGGNGFVAIAEQWVPSGLAAVVVATMPLWAALFARPWGERASWGEWAGLALGFAGVALLRARGGLGDIPAGGLLIIVAPACWALGSVLTPRVTLPAGAMATAAEMLAGGAAMLLLGPLFGERPGIPSLRSLGALAYLIVFGSLVAFSAYGFLLRTTRRAVATSYAFVNPLFALALGAYVGGAVPPLAWLSLAAVIGSVVLVRLTPPRAAETAIARYGSRPADRPDPGGPPTRKSRQVTDAIPARSAVERPAASPMRSGR